MTTAAVLRGTGPAPEAIELQRAPSCPRVRNESHLWNWVRLTLRANGYDAVKRRMVLDGHLVDTHEYYVRDRKWGWYIRDDQFAFRDLAALYNAGSTIRLRVQPFPNT